MKKAFLALLIAAVLVIVVGTISLVLASREQIAVVPQPAPDTSEGSNEEDVSEPAMAFFYQTVGLFKNGIGTNAVLVGKTTDGEVVESYDIKSLEWDQGFDVTDSYGDPVFSRLSNGNWAMTSWTTTDDPRGSGAMMYWEGECPMVDDEEVIAINPSNAPGCKDVRFLQIGKTSQVFTVDNDRYVFHASMGGLYLAHLASETQEATELSQMCVLSDTAEGLEDLGWGESMPVIVSEDLLVSDSAIARRTDGTWVLFMKGIPKDSGCEEQGGLCELCARGIYRTTSDDLVNWSELERVVSQASVPEATQTVDGTVWLYYQDFSDTCEAQKIQLANIAPISGVYEMGSSHKMSTSVQVEFSDEAFETNKNIHYATNGNPVMLPDTQAQEDFEACFE